MNKKKLFWLIPIAAVVVAALIIVVGSLMNTVEESPFASESGGAFYTNDLNI